MEKTQPEESLTRNTTDPQNKEQMKTLTLLLCLQFWQSRYSKNQCIFIGGFLWLPNYKNICVAY